MKNLTVSMTKREAVAGYIYLALQLTVIPILISLGNMLMGAPLSDAQINFLFFCINFLCVTIIFRKFLVANTQIAFKNLWKCLQSAFFGFIFYWLLAMVVGFIILLVYPEFSNVNDESIGQLMEENTGLIQFGAVLLVPITEELLYRGLVFGSFYKRKPLAGYLISMAAFAALHVVGYVTMYEPLHLMLCFLQYLPAGFCLAWAYARADSIWAPILIHIAINQIGTAAMR